MLGPLPVHDPVGESDAVFTVAGGVHELCRCLEILAVHGVDEPLVDIGGADAWAPAGCAHADPSLTQVTRRLPEPARASGDETWRWLPGTGRRAGARDGVLAVARGRTLS